MWRLIPNMKCVKHNLLSVLVFALATGCQTTPPSSQNELPEVRDLIPDNWSQPVLSGTFSTDWLEDLGDERVLELIETAFEKNPSLQAAVYRLQQAEANAQIVGAVRYPTLQLALAGNKQKFLFSGIGRFEASNYNLGLSSRWEIDLWGKIRDRHRVALGNLEAAGYDLEAVRLSLVSQVCKAWFNAKEALNQYRLAVDTAESFTANLKTLEKRYERGLTDAFDLRLSRAQAASARAVVQTRKTAFDGTVRLLETLLGEYPGAAIEISDSLALTMKPIPAHLPASLLEQRPDLKAVERRLAALNSNADAARKNRLPAISLTGTLGSASEDLKDLLSEDFTVWSLAGNLAASIFQGGSLEGERNLAEAQFQEQLAHYESAILNAFREVESALANHEFFSELESEVGAAAEQNAKALDQAWDLYERGLVDIIAVLEAERRSFTTRSDHILAINRIVQNRIDLYVALGGGFNGEGINL